MVRVKGVGMILTWTRTPSVGSFACALLSYDPKIRVQELPYRDHFLCTASGEVIRHVSTRSTSPVVFCSSRAKRFVRARYTLSSRISGFGNGCDDDLAIGRRSYVYFYS